MCFLIGPEAHGISPEDSACAGCYQSDIFNIENTFFNSQIIHTQFPVQNTCLFQRPVLRIGFPNHNRNFFLCSHRPTPETLRSKTQFVLHHLCSKIFVRSNATAALGRTGLATGKSETSASGWSTVTLWQSGITRPQPVEISRDARTIRGDEKTMKVGRLQS